MKPIKETKLGIFLKDKAPKVLDIVGDLLPEKGVLGIVKNLISSDPDIKPEDKLEFQKMAYDFDIEMAKLEIQDRSNARDMQKAALSQDDLFSKRFMYYLAAFVVITSAGYGVALLFVDVPESNKRLVEQFADMYLLTGALMVLSFFFGSSKTSQDKTAMMEAKKKD